jgi:hypothetical protein
LEQKERRAEVTEDLRAPWQADQIVVFQYAAMRLQFAVCGEGEDEMFVAQADELCNFARRGVSRGWVPGHEIILSRNFFISLQS